MNMQSLALVPSDTLLTSNNKPKMNKKRCYDDDNDVNKNNITNLNTKKLKKSRRR